MDENHLGNVDRSAEDAQGESNIRSPVIDGEFGPGTPVLNPQKARAQKWLPLFKEFISNLRIDSKEVAAADAKGVKLNLWGSQLLALEILCAGMEDGIRNFMFLKGRQAGISTVFLAVDIFWLAVHPGMIGALVTDTDQNRSVFRAIIQRYYKSFPKKFLGGSFQLEQDNKDFMLFSNGSRLDFIVAGRKKTFGEGKGYALCHMTEVANFGSPEGLASFKETLAEQNPNRLFIHESTAKGFNHWKDMWDEFGRDTQTKRRGFIGWWAKEMNRIERDDKRFKIYGIAPLTEEEKETTEIVKKQYKFNIEKEQWAWHRWRRSEGDRSDADAKQNQPSTADEAFVFTGNLFFQAKKMQDDWIRANDLEFHAYKYIIGTDFRAVALEKITDPRRLKEVTLRIWEEPVEGATYAIGMDPSLGGNAMADRHAIQVRRCFADCTVQVAEFADNIIDTRQAAWVLAHLAGWYKNVWINIETTGGAGNTVMTEFDHQREILRIRSDQQAEADVLAGKYDRSDDIADFLSNARWYIMQRADSFTPERCKGFKTVGGNSGGAKLELLLQYRDKHATDQLIIRSIPLINEMKGVIQNGYEVKAMGRNKDDRVFADALANRIWIDNIQLPMLQRSETYAMVMGKSEEKPNEMQNFMNGLVQSFWARREEEFEALSMEETFLDRRGFLK